MREGGGAGSERNDPKTNIFEYLINLHFMLVGSPMSLIDRNVNVATYEEENIACVFVCVYLKRMESTENERK